MSISLLLSAVGVLVAVAGAGLLLARVIPAPRIDLIAWTVALLGLAVSLGAQTLGHLGGFGEYTFRAMEIGAAEIAPLALILGMCEIAGKSMPARFAARLFIPALAITPLVILATDPLGGTAFTKATPDMTAYYELPAIYAVKFGLAPLTVVVALAATAVTGYRFFRAGPAWRNAFLPVAAAGVAALALAAPGLALDASASQRGSAPATWLLPVLCLLAAGLTWLAGMRASGLSLGLLRERGPDQAGERWDADDAWARLDQTGDYEPISDTGGQGVYRGGGLYRPTAYARDDAAGNDNGNAGYDWQDQEGGYRIPGYADPAYPGRREQGERAPGFGQPAGAGYPAGSGSTAQGLAGAGQEHVPGYDAAQPGPDGVSGPAAAGYGGRLTHELDRGPHPPFGQGAGDGAAAGAGTGRQAEADDPERSKLYGQIAIYTLLEDRVPEFDRLTEHVVEQVRSSEPDTLVYIVHAVPSAPMQRILYEVYRDRAAYEAHRRQPYVSQFDIDRRPYVLATNVIELGLQQAKVSPFPSVADLFGEPAFDTSGFERPDYLRDYGKSPSARESARRRGRR